MGKTEQGIMTEFFKDTGIRPKGCSDRLCRDFAHIIIIMLEDAELSTPAARHCQFYAEKRAEKGHTISHGMFYRDNNLKAMQEWFIAKYGKAIKEEKFKDDKDVKIKKLEDQLRRIKRQRDGLILNQQMVDSLVIELETSKNNEIKNNILLERAFRLLEDHGLINHLNHTIDGDELYRHYFEQMKEVNAIINDLNQSNDLVHIKGSNIDEQ